MTDLMVENAPGNDVITEEKPRRKRGRKPGQKPKSRPDIPFDEFDIEEVPAEERVEHKRRREERSEQQKGIDDIVAQNYNAWVESGMPTNWADMPIIRWKVAKTFADDAEFMVRKAAALYGRKPIFGQKEEMPDGRMVLPFCIIARPPRKEKSSE